jgi:hypothetical protein
MNFGNENMLYLCSSLTRALRWVRFLGLGRG